ncbi:MAG: hypothetical protein AAGG72_01680, partial [Pseudomonadota bacterium]
PHGTVVCLRIARRAWDTLHPDDQQAFQTAAEEVFLQTAHEAEMLRRPVHATCASKGVRFTRLTDEAISGIDKVSAAAIAHAAAFDALTQRIDATYGSVLRTFDDASGGASTSV